MFTKIFVLSILTGTAFAGVAYEEESLTDMADVIVEGEVIDTTCVSRVEDKFSIVTQYSATVAVADVLKGEADAEVEIQSTLTEYKQDQPACDDSGSIHPVGQVARFYLEQGGDTLVDFHWSGTIELDGSQPRLDPECSDEVSTGGCSTIGAVSGLVGFAPALLVFVRRRD
jgi:hypothetical protein